MIMWCAHLRKAAWTLQLSLSIAQVTSVPTYLMQWVKSGLHPSLHSNEVAITSRNVARVVSVSWGKRERE